MELEALQETAADIKAQGASLVVISPQLEKYSKSMVKKHNLTFPLLRDEANQLASQFGLAFKLPDDLAGLYSQFGIDLVRYNDNDLWSLPMPGRFVRPKWEGGQCRGQSRLHPPSGAVGNCSNLEKNGLIK
ncbi:MAG: redoxin domain-containing protein [Deltaproteobacteria bacterium]|nr:redoxin domain-containing protein [Deltaproteobacteria bacterium]